MFKSSFMKYVITFAAITLVGFIILSSIVSTTVSNYSFDEKEIVAENISGTAASVCEKLYIASLTDMPFGEFVLSDSSSVKAFVASLYDNTDNVEVILADKDGKIAYATEKLKTDAYSEDIAREISKTKSGENYFDSEGLLGGTLPERCIVAVSPIFNAEGEFIGSCAACALYADYSMMVRTMKQTFFMSSICIFLAAIIAFYFICDHMVTPMRVMVKAAESFAEGNFDTRVNIGGSDELSRLAIAFNDMADALDKANKTRMSFVSNVAHDLRTPMTTISGFIDGITGGAIPKEKEEYYLGVISDEVHRLSRLVTQLLDMTRLDSGERKFTFINFDICEMARLVLISFEARIESKRLDVEFECDEDRIMVHGDKDSIHQVIYNLVDNAVKFANEGGQLAIKINHSGGRMVSFEVLDSGKTISEEDLPLLFERFYKADKSRGLDNNGYGLGLYIVKSIVEANGGKIVCKSENDFTSFIFTLKAAAFGKHENSVK